MVWLDKIDDSVVVFLVIYSTCDNASHRSNLNSRDMLFQTKLISIYCENICHDKSSKISLILSMSVILPIMIDTPKLIWLTQM